MKAPTKVWALFLVAITVAPTARGVVTSDYEVAAESIENHPEISREFADWHMSLKRISKTEKVIDGHYTVKKDIVRPKVQIETFYLTHNKFIKVDINQRKWDVCDNVTLSFLEEFFEGNSTRDEDCVIKPGHMEMRKDRKINVDELAHKEYHTVFFGTFKSTMTITNEDGELAGKVTWTVIARKRSR